MFMFLKALPLKLWGYLALFFTLLGVAAKIYKSGGQARDIENLVNTVERARKRDEIEDDVDQLSDDDVISRLRDKGWLNDR